MHAGAIAKWQGRPVNKPIRTPRRPTITTPWRNENPYTSDGSLPRSGLVQYTLRDSNILRHDRDHPYKGATSRSGQNCKILECGIGLPSFPRQQTFANSWVVRLSLIRTTVTSENAAIGAALNRRRSRILGF